MIWILSPVALHQDFSPLDSFFCDALDLPEDKGLGIDQVVPLPIVAGGLQLHQHHETDQGLPEVVQPGE